MKYAENDRVEFFLLGELIEGTILEVTKNTEYPYLVWVHFQDGPFEFELKESDIERKVN